MRAIGSAASRWPERAKQLNPHHPGWYWYADFYNAYRQGDYRGALGFALKINIPGHWFMHAAMCACYGQLGEREAASKALRDLLKLTAELRRHRPQKYREVVGARLCRALNRWLA